MFLFPVLVRYNRLIPGMRLNMYFDKVCHGIKDGDATSRRGIKPVDYTLARPEYDPLDNNSFARNSSFIVLPTHSKGSNSSRRQLRRGFWFEVFSLFLFFLIQNFVQVTQNLSLEGGLLQYKYCFPLPMKLLCFANRFKIFYHFVG